jgi:hypothetical protein
MSQIGTIDCGYLSTVQAMQEEIWADPMSNADLVAEAEAAKAVLENQKVNFGVITNTNKNKKVSVEWLRNCELAAQDCTDDCNIIGLDATPECKEYELTCLKEVPFQVAERGYRDRTIDMQKAIALNMLTAKKALDEWLAQYVVAGLVAGSGVNQFTGGIGNVVGPVTEIAAANWNDAIWGYFNRVIRGNKFNSSYLLTGDNLFQYLFNRSHEGMTDAGKAALAKIGAIGKTYLDPVAVETVAPATTFLIHGGAAALVTKAWNPLGAENAVEPARGHFLWSEPSKNLPGVVYDVIQNTYCYNNEFYHGYKVQVHGLFATSPYPCNDQMTGILAFECV